MINRAINFFDKSVNYSKTVLGEKGQYVNDGFEYNSRTNEDFLSIPEIKKRLKKLNI